MSTTSATSRLAALGWKATEAHRIGAAELVNGLLVHPLALASAQDRRDPLANQRQALAFEPRILR